MNEIWGKVKSVFGEKKQLDPRRLSAAVDRQSFRDATTKAANEGVESDEREFERLASYHPSMLTKEDGDRLEALRNKYKRDRR